MVTPCMDAVECVSTRNALDKIGGETEYMEFASCLRKAAEEE